MEAVVNCFKNVHSPLYDRRLMIMILKKYSYGRRSFSENCRASKIKDECIYRQYGSVIQAEQQKGQNSQDAETPRV